MTGLQVARRAWTPVELALLRTNYAESRTDDLAAALGRSLTTVYQKATVLGLRKSAAYLETDNACRIQRGKQSEAMKGTQFKAGHASWNKGLKGVVGVQEACRATQFKAGQLNGRAAHLVVPLGSYRINGDGYLDRKVSEQSGAQTLRWKAVHRLVWEAAHGPVPSGHVVVFRAGRRSTDPDAITLDALELITRRDLMLRNTFHRYGPEVSALVQLRGAITRQINKRSKA